MNVSIYLSTVVVAAAAVVERWNGMAVEC